MVCMNRRLMICTTTYLCLRAESGSPLGVALAIVHWLQVSVGNARNVYCLLHFCFLPFVRLPTWPRCPRCRPTNEE
ncbi:hypothetical protein F4821DRAFT_237565 [Hypoxylon rubiginosum]|uniref:Uncharacterized protein n=1 Tax=Hypoxylon rubiginosum TaxID=110542 RepID=A0ACC0D2A9_9PEZI|nr:hypothetical protein F4821DRAFT_237565 [Hypoxylon rubiginosum]